MKISKYLWIEKGVRFNQLQKVQIRARNQCKKHFYLVCTSYQSHLLFDIIESQYLTQKYEGCYLVGVAKTKEGAVKHVGKLIDELYNLQTLSYEMIKT